MVANSSSRVFTPRSVVFSSRSSSSFTLSWSALSSAIASMGSLRGRRRAVVPGSRARPAAQDGGPSGSPGPDVRPRASNRRVSCGRRSGRHELDEHRSRRVDERGRAAPVEPAGLGGKVRVAVQPEGGPDPIGEEPVRGVAAVVRVGGRVPGIARWDVAHDEERRAWAAEGIHPEPRDLPPRALLVVPGAVAREPRPRQREDREPRDGSPVDAVGRRRDAGGIRPWAAVVVVAAYEQQRRQERVGDERQPVGRQVAAPDDNVDLSERFAVALVVQRVIGVVGDRKDPDGSAVARRERCAVGPVDLEAARHGRSRSGASSGGGSGWAAGASSGGGSGWSPRARSGWASGARWGSGAGFGPASGASPADAGGLFGTRGRVARLVDCRPAESTRTGASGPAGRIAACPGSITTRTSASMSSWPFSMAIATRLCPSVTQYPS